MGVGLSREAAGRAGAEGGTWAAGVSSALGDSELEMGAQSPAVGGALEAGARQRLAHL